MSILDGREWEELSFEERLAIKIASESSFLNFVRIWFEITMGEPLMVNWHHKWFADEIDKRVKGTDMSSLAIAVPPGSTKTEFFSIFIHAYTLALVRSGKLRRFRNLAISSGKALVERNSRRVRDIITCSEFQELWPCAFSTNQSEEWIVVDERGSAIATMVSKPTGGQIIGSRGGYPGKGYSGGITIDDGDKAEDMFSSVKRDRSHRITTNTIRSRRGDRSNDHPTPVIIIQQRLHVDDMIGFCMSGGMGIDFKSIVIPALIDEAYVDSLPDDIRDYCREKTKDSPRATVAGNEVWSFWEEMEGLEQLLKLKDIDEYTFMSQYMQAPISLGGNIFSSDWWKFYGPDEDTQEPIIWDYRFITGDTAQKTKTYNDFSVFCEWGVFQGNLYLIDMVRGKWEAPELRAVFIQFVSQSWAKNELLRGNLRKILVEDKSSGTGLIQECGRNTPVPITSIQRNVDKTTRAVDCAPQIKQGKVFLPAGKAWISEFIAEHSAFTADDSHRHDDMVDNTMDAIQDAILSNSDASIKLFNMMRRGR